MPDKRTVEAREAADQALLFRIFKLAVIIGLCIVLARLLTSCAGDKAIFRKEDKLYRKNAPAVNAWHSQHYKPVVIDSTHTEFIPGDIMVVHDTTEHWDTSTRVLVRDIHHYHTQHDTVRTTHTIQTEYTAHIEALQDTVRAATKEASKQQARASDALDDRDSWRSKCIWTWSILALIIICFAGSKIWKLYKQATTIKIAQQ
jgi:hypothetical protein